MKRLRGSFLRRTNRNGGEASLDGDDDDAVNGGTHIHTNNNSAAAECNGSLVAASGEDATVAAVVDATAASTRARKSSAIRNSNNNNLERSKPQPDLSNLWSRRQSVEGCGASTKRSAVRYPKLKEHAVRVPPTEAILTKNLPYGKTNTTMEAAVPAAGGGAVVGHSTTSKPPALPRTTKPGAVAVAGNIAPPQQAKHDNDKSTLLRPAATAAVPTAKSIPVATALPAVAVAAAVLVGSKTTSSSAARTTTTTPRMWGQTSGSLSGESNDDDRESPPRAISLNSADSSWGKKPSPKPTQIISSDEWSMLPPPATTASSNTTTFGGIAKNSLLDDDDDDDDEALETTPAFASLATAGGASMPPPSRVLGYVEKEQPIWGRKTKKSALEEDVPDSRELAFATSASTSSSFSLTTKKPPPLATDHDKGQSRHFASAITKASSVDSAPSVKHEQADRKHHSTILSGGGGCLTEEEQVESAILESQKQQQPQSDRVVTILLAKEIEDANENARSVRSMIASDDVDVGFLQTVLDMCRGDQKKVARGIEDAMNQDGDETDLEVLIDLNSNILDAIEAGERIARDNQKPSAKRKDNLDMEDLIEKKDIFSLLCMLRVQQNEKRLDAAMALMKFARAAERHEDVESVDLRDEIRSSGGLHSLLTLFRTQGTLYELKVVTALAVAYVLPSFVESSSQTPPSLGLKIVMCLRFLISAHSVSHDGEVLGEDEMFKASVMALATFWVNHLEPMLNSTDAKSADSDALQGAVSLGRQRSRGTDHRQEAIALDELLEMTVSLIIYVAKQESKDTALQLDGDNSLKLSYTLVEQVCAVEIARPIAVREGILQILVSWIRSKDRERIRPAASALRYVTSINDKYMAGWIHSEMVNKGAVQCLADLTRDISVTRDVRLAIAQILSSLCAAPHTRAAVVEANCINFLIGVLYEHNDPSSEEVALFAGRAILQLAAGAITRASAFSGDDLEVLGFVSPDKRDSLVGDIVESGAISSFVSIAQNNRGMLRSIAIQALRVISEDVSTSRRTRLQLCEDSAAMALGTTLKDNVAVLGDVLKSEAEDVTPDLQDSLRDLHEALCALANILDPAQEGDPTSLMRTISSSSSAYKDPLLLIKGCLETANSGGLESLLAIALLRFDEGSNRHNMELLEEACRSLASMAPLLVTSKVAAAGYAKWAHDVFLALHHVLKQIGDFDTLVLDLRVIVLQGLGALAKSAPLKVRIIDKTLPYLLQAKNVRNQSDVSNAASQAFQSLDLADDEVAAQVAGNAPNVFAEWFCLQRSLLIQAMARAEIRRLVHSMWNVPFQETDHGLTKLMRECSVVSRSSDETRDSADAEFFGCFTDDEETSRERELLISQYNDVYGMRYADGSLSGSSSSIDAGSGLLSYQTYPLSSCDTETTWILDHRRSVLDSETKSTYRLSDHVEKLLGYCFPSVLLRDEVIPITTLQPEASFNFRALMMAQRRYFSFRREGQLLSSLCDKEVASLGSTDAHWTLSFTNSSFAGEFAESLVQVLYKCPTIRGLSFVKNADWNAPDDDGEKDNDGDSGGALLANLAGSLPPWISHLTFEGFFDDADLRTLVFILETMGKLSAGHQGATEQGREGASFQGKFRFLAIRRSPQLSAEAWLPFFKLLGARPSIARRPSASTLVSLKALDLSGNQLGDDLCASVLEIVYDEASGCKIERLDLSSNRIQAAARVLRVLRAYYNKRVSGMGSGGANWKSSLHTLSFASNGLHLGRVWLELITLIQNNGLGLKSLDLSSNDLTLGDTEHEVANILVQTMTSRGGMDRLNLSHNSFSSALVDHIILELSEREAGDVILELDGNAPPLIAEQYAALQKVSWKTRTRTLQRHLIEREKLKNLVALGVDSKPDLESANINQELISEGHSIDSFSPNEAIVSESSTGLGDNLITVLFSAPLVFTDGRTLRPFAKLDFDMERELMWQCLKEASRDIELSFDSATHDRLLATMAKRCSCLHYSGHGHQHYLPFEDGSGGPYWFKVDQFKSLIEREGGAPFRFVFVSACYSYLAGETFASAGVPHVVCCQQESELKDTAALAFTRQFYLALAIGHTVKDSFEQGCKAVRATPNLKDPDKEMNKFLLLPKDGNHNVPIFNAKPVPEWPKHFSEERNNRSRRTNTRGAKSRNILGGARSSELSVRNMMQEDPSPSPPEFFLGREVDMYYVLKAVLGKRLVSVVGEPGVGRSSLVCALCHYINERASTIIGIDRIYFVKARQSHKRNPFRSLVQRFLKKLVEDETARPIDPDADMETMFDTICKFLKHEKALVVFDRAELVVDADEANEFPMLLSKLCRETKNVKVLLTNRRDLGIPSLGEHPISLGPLNFADTVRLFANLCPYLHTPADRKKLFETLVKDQEEAEVLATDPGVLESTKLVFAILGGGFPSRIEKAAYDLSKEDFLSLYKL